MGMGLYHGGGLEIDNGSIEIRRHGRQGNIEMDSLRA